MARDRARLTSVGVAVVPLAAIAVLVGYPVAGLARRTFDLSNLVDTVTAGWFWRAWRFTLWQATVSTVATAVVGLPLAGLLSRRRFLGRSALRALVTAPFVMPTVVVAGAYLTLFRQLGLDREPLDLTESTTAIVAAHVFFNLAVVVRVVATAWEGLDPTATEVAQTMGASPARAFVGVTLPALRPALSAAAAIVFAFSVTSYGVVRVLGGPRRATLETEIYRFGVSRLDVETATSLAFVQLATVVLVVWVAGRAGASVGSATLSRFSARADRPLGGRQRLAAGALVTAVVAYIVAPLTALTTEAFRYGGGWSLHHMASLVDRSTLLPVVPARTLVNSLLVAAVAVIAALVIGGLAAVASSRHRGPLGRVVEGAVTLPLAISAVSLGLGMLVTFDRPIGLRSSWWVIPLAHAVVGAPFVARAVGPAMRSVGPDLRDAASVLGASPAVVARTVIGPLVSRSVAVGASFAFAVSLGEFGATSFLARRDDQLTAPIAIVRLLGRPGDEPRGQAAAMGVVVLALTVAVVATGDRVARKRPS